MILLSNISIDRLTAQATIAISTPPPPFYECGIIEKLAGIPDNYTGQVLYDRFGNTWTVPELQALSANATANCDAGVFKLQFKDVPAYYQTTICEVFTYVSTTIGGGSVAKVPIQIDWVVLSGNFAAQATSFQFYSDCNRVKNTVQQGIRNSSTDLPLGAVAGLVRINSAVNWYKGPTNNITNGTVDLYTAVLHEALHLLGVASLIGETPNAAHFTEYDRYLAHKVNTAYDPLIINVPNVTCCSVMADNPISTPNLSLGCDGNIFFTNIAGSPTTEIVEVAYLDQNGQPGSLGNIPNRLSHFDIRCGGTIQYVMHPGVGVSPEPFSEPRRTITSPEIDVLCRIGYPGAGSCNNCALLVQDDDVTDKPIFLFLANGNPNPDLSITLYVDLSVNNGSNYNLLSNDITPGLLNATFELVTPHPGLNITITQYNVGIPGHLNVVVTDNTPGIKTFKYKMTVCGQCQYGTVYIRVLEKPIAVNCDIDPDCNLVCFGDFEDFAYGSGMYNTLLNLPNYGFTTPPIVPVNTVDIYSDPNSPIPNNNLLHWYVSPESNGTYETVIVPISSAIESGCSSSISYEALYFNPAFLGGAITPENVRLEFYGLTGYPCSQITELPAWDNTHPVGSSFEFCPGVTAYRIKSAALDFDDDITLTPVGVGNILNNVDQLAEHSFDYPHEGLPITHILVFGDYDPLPVPPPNFLFYYAGFLLDNLYVTSSCNNQITVTPTVTQACQGGQAIIKYDVCLEGNGASAPVQLQASVPPAYQQFVTFVPGGGFDANGLATFNLTPGPDCNGGSNTTTLTLTVNLASNIAANTFLDLDMAVVSGNTCINSSSSDGDVVLEVQDCDIDLTACKCAANTNNYTIGANLSSITNLSATALPSSIANHCISVNGKLRIDGNLSLDNCTVIMNKGAEIEIQGGKQLTLTNGTSLYGCNNMWKGITVLQQGKLTMEGTANAKVSISDAQYAVKLLNGAEIKLLHAIFDKNYIDVQAVSNSGLITVSSGIGNCTFTATGALKAGYPGQSPNPGSTPYAAFNLLNVVGFNFGGKALVTVDNHRFGLRARQSSFSMSNVTMSDFVGGNQDKVGVLANLCPSAKVKDCKINGFILGVLSTNSNTEIMDTKFNFETLSTISQTGITISAQTGKLTKLRNNQIERCGTGIRIYNTYGNDGSEVYNNTIRKFYTPAGSSGVLSAIDLNNVTSFNISNNPIGDGSTGSNHYGLTMSRCSENRVANNTISSMKRGIDNSSGSFNYFEQNTIQKHPDGADLPSEGFYVSGSTDDYCFNTTKNLTEDGFIFVGDCDPSVVSRSQIYGAKTGLRIFANNSAIGEQNNYKNRWFGPFSSGFGAFHESADDQQIDDSRFLTQSNLIPSWNTNAGNMGIDWFKSIPNDPPSPSPQPLCPTYSASGKTSSNDEKTAQGDYTGPFAEAYTWEARIGLYQRIQTDASVINNNTDVANFYQQSAETPVGQFVQARKAIHEFFALNTNLRQQYYAGSTQAVALNDQLDAALAQPQPNWATVGVLQNQLRESTRQFLTLDKGFQQKQSGSLSLVKTSMNNLADAQVYQSNEKTVWQNVLDEQLWQPDAQPSATTVQELEAIAAQCAIAGSKGVYIARSLLQQWGMGYNWDDRLLCVVKKERNDDTEVTQKWLVVPNPAQDILVFQHSSPLIADGRITVFNTLGTMVLQTTVAEGQRQFAIPVANWANGLYYYQIEGIDTAKQNGTFIIQH